MQIFIVERKYADEMEKPWTSLMESNGSTQKRACAGFTLLLSAEQRKTYCLYEAASPEVIKSAAARAGLPADVIVEVTDRLMPDAQSPRFDRYASSS